MKSFGILPSSISVSQQLYDIFIPPFFLVCFLMSLPKKLDALRYASMVTAVINGFITIVRQIRTS